MNKKWGDNPEMGGTKDQLRKRLMRFPFKRPTLNHVCFFLLVSKWCERISQIHRGLELGIHLHIKNAKPGRGKPRTFQGRLPNYTSRDPKQLRADGRAQTCQQLVAFCASTRMNQNDAVVNLARVALLHVCCWRASRFSTAPELRLGKRARWRASARA